MLVELLEPSLVGHAAQLRCDTVGIARIKSSSCSIKATCAGGCSAETCKEREEGLGAASSNTCFISGLPTLSFWSKADLGAEASLGASTLLSAVWEHTAGFSVLQWL